MEKQLLQVLEFQTAFGVRLPSKPAMLGKKRKALRQRLLEEEVKELEQASNILDVADALCDILYITYGTAHEHGLADRLVMLFDEVHKSNMSKMGANGKPEYREDGKVMKPEGYRPPNLRKIIERDFTALKNNEVIQEMANEMKSLTEKKIEAKIKEKLGLFDKFLFWLSDKIESNLKKKIKVNFPQSIFGEVTVQVYGKDHTIEK